VLLPSAITAIRGGVQRRRSLHFDLGIPIDYHNKNDFHGIDEMNLDHFCYDNLLVSPNQNAKNACAAPHNNDMNIGPA
jgi:hypothetical protein